MNQLNMNVILCFNFTELGISMKDISMYFSAPIFMDHYLNNNYMKVCID